MPRLAAQQGAVDTPASLVALWATVGGFTRGAAILTAVLLLCAGTTVAFAAPIDSGFRTQQRLGFRGGDDWEPALAVDRDGRLFALYKHYNVGGQPTCAGCDRHLLLQRSLDGGRTWTGPRPIAPGPVHGGQYDPQIAVDPIDGHTVWASFLQGSNSEIAVVKSLDSGRTWTPPTIVSARPPGLDKDELAVRGQTVAVAYDDNFNTWLSISRDAGVTWSTHLIFPGTNRFNISLAAGAAIDSHGSIFVSFDSFDKAHSQRGNGPATLWVASSYDNGVTWERRIIAVSGAAPRCSPCGYAYLSAQMALKVGVDDTIYLLWNGTPTLVNGAPERIYFSISRDHGRSYSPRSDVSGAPAGVEHSFPALATGRGPGDVRLGWMDKRTGLWNVFYRAGMQAHADLSSSDGGEDLGPVIKMSSYVPGYSYLVPRGFKLPYGDYFSMVVAPRGNADAVFGEGPSYQGPGNIWFAAQRTDDR